MKKITLLIGFIFLLLFSVGAREFAQDYNNALTRSIADALYCKIDGSCINVSELNLSLANFTVGLVKYVDLDFTGTQGLSDGVDNDTKYTNLSEFVDDIGATNHTIDTDTHVEGDGIYLTNDSTTMFFDEGKLNSTALLVCQVYDDTTLISQVNTTANIEGLGFVTGNHTIDTDTDTHVEGDNVYLYNNSITMFLNDSKLNLTIGEIINKSSIDPSQIQDIWVNESGDSMTGNLNMTGNNVTDIFHLRFDRNDSYFFYNSTNGTLQLVVNGELQQDWGASSRFYQDVTFFDDIFGDGSTLLNVCLPNGTTVNGQPCNATSIFNVDEIWINNIFGNATFNESKLNITIGELINLSEKEVFFVNLNFTNTTGFDDFIDNDTKYFNLSEFVDDIGATNHTVDTDTQKEGSQPYLYNDSTFIYFNESKNNLTIQELAEVKKYTENISVSVVGGYGSTISSTVFDFEITRVTVTPAGVGSYRFEAVEESTKFIIDKDRIAHTGVWDIEKSHAIDNEQINVTISNAVTDGTYNVMITFLDNFRP